MNGTGPAAVAGGRHEDGYGSDNSASASQPALTLGLDLFVFAQQRFGLLLRDVELAEAHLSAQRAQLEQSPGRGAGEEAGRVRRPSTHDEHEAGRAQQRGLVRLFPRDDGAEDERGVVRGLAHGLQDGHEQRHVLAHAL